MDDEKISQLTEAAQVKLLLYLIDLQSQEKNDPPRFRYKKIALARQQGLLSK